MFTSLRSSHLIKNRKKTSMENKDTASKLSMWYKSFFPSSLQEEKAVILSTLTAVINEVMRKTIPLSTVDFITHWHTTYKRISKCKWGSGEYDNLYLSQDTKIADSQTKHSAYLLYCVVTSIFWGNFSRFAASFVARSLLFCLQYQ